jgi:uncharacterized protein with ParB-like and HNH nuclease domain
MIKSASITRTQFTIADFVSWMRNGELNLSPSFQRRPVWKISAKSYLLDTIVRGLPTPIIFLRQITDTKKLTTIREVVDGQQRIRTLLSFIDKKLLKDWKKERDDFTVTVTHNADIAGKTFTELDQDYKQRILDYQFSTHILPTDTSDQQVLDIFRRMNATGTKLNSQELRNAEFGGEFIQSVYEVSLASLDLWRKWRVFSEDNIARMEEAEFVSELYIMMLNGVSEKSQAKIEKFYDDYDKKFPERQQLEKRLNLLLTEVDEAYGDQMRSSPLSNRIILYALIAALYEFSYGAGASLKSSVSRSRPQSLANKLRKLSDRLQEKHRSNLPLNVQEALLSRPGRKANRAALAKFISKRLAT